ncbi:MAG: carboxypeptidase regulatory-like domain-containing protein [Deltaproteobacteria bacterium]|nr:carboxypeptidase regulatory-like domain-containing protein [Deltaproteobacteria bacterium]
MEPVDDDAASREKRDEARRGRIVRIAVLGFAAALAVAVVLTIARSGGLEIGGGEGSGSGSGGAARVSVPEAPKLPGAAHGVRLTGVVVDGAGAPVAGAELSAEMEKGVIDAALAGRPASGSASASPSTSGGSGVATTGSGGAGSSGVAVPGSVPGSGAGGSGVAATGSATGSGASSSGVAATGSAPGSGGAGGAGHVTVAPATGLDGRFAVDGLAPGRYRLRVTGPGLLPAEVRYVPVPSDEARIVVARQVAVEGVVVDGGAPAVGVTVGLRGEAIGGGIEATTDGKGAFRFGDLPEGGYQVYAFHEARAARAVRVGRLGAGPFDKVELRLEAAAIVVGRVVDREDASGLAAAVELRPSGDDQAPRYARSAGDGSFRIEGVPLGRWVADAYAPGYTSPGSVELEAGRGAPEVALARGGVVEGRVLDGAGNPVAGATVRARSTGAGTAEHTASIEQDKLRRFSGRLATPAGAPGGLASDPQLLPRGELGVLVGPIPPLPPPGALAVRPATLDASDPAASRSLAAEPPPLPERPDRAAIWTTGSDGRYRITGLAASPKVAVIAAAPGYAEGRSRQVALGLGQVVTGVDVALTAGTMLFGRVTDQHRVPIGGAQVTVTPELGAPLETFSDDDGTYRVGPVSGTVVLAGVAFGHGEAQKKLELAAERGAVPGEHREDLALAIADAMIAGTLDDTAGAPVASATLEVIGGGGYDGRHAVVATDGTFALEGLPAGPTRVRITHPDYPPLEVDAVAGPPTAARVRWRLPMGGAVEGALLDGASGAPLVGIAISGDGPGVATADAATDADGRWKLGPLVPGTWKLEVALPGYRPFVREIDVPVGRAPGAITVRDIRIDLARGALVGGTVRDSRGNRVAGARVTAQGEAGAGAPCDGTTDHDGEFRLRDCPTGELVVVGARGDVRGSVRTTVRPGDEILTLSIEIK